MTNSVTESVQAEVMAPAPEMAVVVRQSQEVAPGLFGTQEPVAVIEKAASVASALKDVIVKQGLVSRIGGKEYPRCEAWTLLGTMLGVFPVLAWSRPLEGGWEARVEARTKDGAVIGAAEAQCMRTERNWSNRDEFALRSMAQTRATAKCLRMPLGFVMSLAGFEVTPAEEMVTDHPHKPPAPLQRAATPQPPQSTAPTPPKPPAPAPARKPLPVATDKTRLWMLKELEGSEKLAREFFGKLVDPTPLAPFEHLSDLPLWAVPVTKEEMKALKSALAAFGNGERAGWPYQPHYDDRGSTTQKASAVVPKVLAKAAVPVNPDPNSPDAPWRTFPMLFGKQAGVPLAELDKKYLYGLWLNFTPQPTWTGTDGREHDTKPEKLAQEKELRRMLDAAGQHYDFREPENEGEGGQRLEDQA